METSEYVSSKKCFSCLEECFIMINCDVCDIQYCSFCSDHFIENKKNCLNCKPHYHVLSKKEQFKNPSNKVRCFNNQFGCEEVLDIVNLSEHFSNCKYFFKNCPNQGCNINLISTEIENHLKLCKKDLIECYFCGMKVDINTKSTHSCLDTFAVNLVKLEKNLNEKSILYIERINRLKEKINAFNKSNSINPNRTCLKCFLELKWGSSFHRINKRCQGSQCTDHFKYYCTQCSFAFCIKCIVPPLEGICGCGKNQKLISMRYNRCDNCREPIRTEGYRCTECDYDTCLNCFKG